MALVQHTLTAPGGNALTGRSVMVTLVSGATGGFVGSTTEVISRSLAVTDSTGVWSVTLTPNAEINPAGSYYTVTQAGETLAFVVPAGVGPFWVKDLLVQAPTMPAGVIVPVPTTDAADIITGVFDTARIPELPYDPAGAADAVTLASIGAATATQGTKADTALQAVALATKADLVGGVVPTSQIPALAITTGQVVVNRAALLALTTTQPGDIVVISGATDHGTYIQVTEPASAWANWLLLNAPTDVVQTVNGQQGTVVLGAADIGADPSGAAAAAQSAAAADAAAKVAAQAVADSATYATLGTDSTQRLMAVLKNETQDASVLVVTDSTGVSADRWVYRWTVMLAADWARWTVLHYIWNDGSVAYDAPTTVQAGTGSRTLRVYSAALSGGTTTSWQSARAAAGIYALTPDVIMVSLGHNEGEGLNPDQWHSQYVALTETITDRLPETDLILIGQNPATANTYQQTRIEVYRQIAAHKGYGFIDVQQAFLDTGNAPGLTIDGVHPTSAGSILWATTVLAAFTYQPGASIRPQLGSTLATVGDNLLIDSTHVRFGDFYPYTTGDPAGWGNNFIACTKETTVFESPNGYAVRLTSSNVAGNLSSWIYPSRGMGRWVTMAVRVFIPAGAPMGLFKIALFDSIGATVSQFNAEPSGGFRWIVVSRSIAASATNLRPYLYVSNVSPGYVIVDRVTLTPGKFPRA